jgi:hypothetical protein
MTDDEHSNDRPANDTPPGVLAPEELTPDEMQQVDDTAHVVPLEESPSPETGPTTAADREAESSRDVHRDATATRDRAAVESITGSGAFAGTARIRTPDGRVRFAADSDDIDEFFSEFLLELLQTMAPDEAPEMTLAVLLQASSFTVTTKLPDDETG